jgi:hypothetical protein
MIGIVRVWSCKRSDCRKGASENCVRRQRDQFRRIGLEESRIARGKAIVDLDILTVDPAETLQSLRTAVTNA